MGHVFLRLYLQQDPSYSWLNFHCWSWERLWGMCRSTLKFQMPFYKTHMHPLHLMSLFWLAGVRIYFENHFIIYLKKKTNHIQCLLIYIKIINLSYKNSLILPLYPYQCSRDFGWESPGLFYSLSYYAIHSETLYL